MPIFPAWTSIWALNSFGSDAMQPDERAEHIGTIVSSSEALGYTPVVQYRVNGVHFAIVDDTPVKTVGHVLYDCNAFHMGYTNWPSWDTLSDSQRNAWDKTAEQAAKHA